MEEYPADVRGRARIWAMTQPDSFWDKAVQRQMVLTAYKLTFRHAFYPRVNGERVRFQLLFHYDQLDITYRGPALPQNFNGKKHIARHYDLVSYIIGKPETASKSDPLLAVVGGVVTERFVLPVDPYLHLQRVGYACMDEGGFPLDSVDAENVEYFYDDECTAEPESGATGTCRGCHCAATLDIDCADAVHEATGAETFHVRFERLAWDDQLAAAIEVLAHNATAPAYLTSCSS